jgi:outer membrane protein TolC
MKKSIKYRIVLALLCGLGATLYAAGRAEAQTLDSLIREALAAHPLTLSAQYRSAAAERRAEAAAALPAPTLSLEFSQVPAGNLDILNRSISNALGVSQMIMTGDKLHAMRRAEASLAAIERENAAESAAAIRQTVAEIYARLWRLDRQQEIIGRTSALLQSLVQAAEQRLLAGKAPLGEGLLARAELAAERAKLHSVGFERRGKNARLNRLLGRERVETEIRPEWDPAEAVTEAESLLARGARQARETIAETNPTLRRMKAMEQMAEAEGKAADATRAPDVMLQGMLMRMPQGMILTSGSPELENLGGTPMPESRVEWMYSLMASVTLPFAPWSAAGIEAKQAEAIAKQRAQAYEREAMNRETLGMIAETEQELAQTLQIAAEYERVVIPAYKQALEGLALSFQTNQSPIADLLRAAQMLAMKEDELAMFREEQMKLSARLRALIGEE